MSFKRGLESLSTLGLSLEKLLSCRQRAEVMMIARSGLGRVLQEPAEYRMTYVPVQGKSIS